MNPVRTWLRRRRDESAIIHAHRLLVDEALRAQAAGATTAEAASIVVGGHRATVQGTAHRLDFDAGRRVDRDALEA